MTRLRGRKWPERFCISGLFEEEMKSWGNEAGLCDNKRLPVHERDTRKRAVRPWLAVLASRSCWVSVSSVLTIEPKRPERGAESTGEGKRRRNCLHITSASCDSNRTDDRRHRLRMLWCLHRWTGLRGTEFHATGERLLTNNKPGLGSDLIGRHTASVYATKEKKKTKLKPIYCKLSFSFQATCESDRVRFRLLLLSVLFCQDGGKIVFGTWVRIWGQMQFPPPATHHTGVLHFLDENIQTVLHPSALQLKRT